MQVARGQIAIGQTRRFESVTGAVFSASAVTRETSGRFDAVRVKVGGRAFYTGSARFTAETGDDLGAGFLMR